MIQSKKRYSSEFKLEALRLLETTGKSAASLERELGISQGGLSRWKRAQDKEGEQAFPGHGRLPLEREQIKQL